MVHLIHFHQRDGLCCCCCRWSERSGDTTVAKRQQMTADCRVCHRLTREPVKGLQCKARVPVQREIKEARANCLARIEYTIGREAVLLGSVQSMLQLYIHADRHSSFRLFSSAHMHTLGPFTLRGFVVNAASSSSHWSHLALAPADWLRLLAVRAAVEGGCSNRSRSRSKNHMREDAAAAAGELCVSVCGIETKCRAAAVNGQSVRQC